MLSKKSIFLSLGILMMLFAGIWAVQSQTDGVTPQDFDPNDPNDVPRTTVIDLEIKGISQIGQIFMVEGIDNQTSVSFDRGSTAAGETSYAPLVLHGIFEKQIRDWRDAVIAGTVTKRVIEIDLLNKAGARVLRITFNNAWPVRFTLPPLSTDSSTRYMERLEFIYDNFTITN